MSATAFDDRRREILRTLIQLHIETGDPVGSENLARALDRTLSPATVRSIMADLEERGYLDHPHPSAGRVPTDDGYRVFVDSLMDRQPLTPGEAAAIASAFSTPDASPERVMENASHILSTLSRAVGFVLAPDVAQTRLRHIDLVPLAAPRVLVVIVSATGLLTQKVIEIEEKLSREDLQACANYLNDNFSGMTLSAIREKLLALMQEEEALYHTLLKRVVALGEQAFSLSDSESNVSLDGTSNMLSRPEFEDLERMRALFRTFEEKGRLVAILNACIGAEGVRILIGNENPDPELRDLSFVTTRCRVEGDEGWGLGVLGSTRMEYGRVVAVVEEVGRTLGHTLRGLRS
jgi:heat-inducible transcriptional repressor